MGSDGNRNQEEAEDDGLVRGQHSLSCQVCGRMVKPEKCSWQEDDGGAICCQDCKAERESCGCSD